MGRNRAARKANRKATRQAKGANGISHPQMVSLADRMKNAIEQKGESTVRLATGYGLTDTYNWKSGAVEPLSKSVYRTVEKALDGLKDGQSGMG